MLKPQANINLTLLPNMCVKIVVTASALMPSLYPRSIFQRRSRFKNADELRRFHADAGDQQTEATMRDIFRRTPDVQTDQPLARREKSEAFSQ